jgi:hypothetical protein
MSKSLFTINETIKLPKNRIELQTYDSKGNLKNSTTTCNTWVQTGYLDYFHVNGFIGPIPANGTQARIRIGTGTSNILITSSDVGGTAINSPNGYTSSITSEEINSVTYYVATYTRSFVHGEVNMAVTQVGLFNGNTMLCGTRLNDEAGDILPFDVTSDERLVINYKVYIPSSLVAEASGWAFSENTSNGEVWGTASFLLNNITPINVTFKRRPFTIYPASNNRIVLNSAFRFTSNAIGSQTLGQDFYYNSTASPADKYLGIRNVTSTLSNFGKTITSVVNLVVNPLDLSGTQTIENLWVATGSSLTTSPIITFDPPLVKGPNDRLTLSFTYTRTIEEVDF